MVLAVAGELDEAGAAGAVEVALAKSGSSAAITAADLEFATTIFAPYVAVMTYPVLPTATMPLTVAVLVAPGVLLVGAA